MSRRLLAVVGIVCGAELVIAMTLGVAGLAALFGLEGLLVGLALVLFTALTVARHRRRKQERNDVEPDHPVEAITEFN